MASKRPTTIAEYVNQSLPEDLVRQIAEYRLRDVREREDDGFW